MQAKHRTPLALLVLALLVFWLPVLAAGCVTPTIGASRTGDTGVPDGDSGVPDGDSGVPDGDTGVPDGDGAVVGSISYQADVYPLLLSYCSVCHSQSGIAGTTDLVLSSDASSDYDAVLALVSAGDPDNSLLLQKAAALTTHDGTEVVAADSVEFGTLADWVEQGAANN